jgi:ethanolamine utilization protein EutN
MQLGRVKGSAVCTVKIPGIEGVKLLVIQPVNRFLQPVGTVQVAVDTVHAGVGDICVLVRSREAGMTLDNSDVAVDLATVGIVDELEVLPDGSIDLSAIPGWNQYT